MRALRNKTLKENAVFANFAAFAADRGRGRSPWPATTWKAPRPAPTRPAAER